MKYKLLFILLALLVQVQTAIADDEVTTAKLTFVVDDASRVSISNAGEEYTIENGSNTFDVAQWSNITIAPKEGCTLLSVVNSQNEAMTIGNDGSVSFMVYEVTPETYTITSEKAAEVNFTIDVDNPSKVSVKNKNYQAITLTEGKNSLKMSALNFPLIIGAASYGQELYKVTMNGVEVPNNYGYAVTPEENSEIVIVADFPDIDYNVTFTEVAGAEDFFTAVMVNKEEVSDFSNGLKVKCGDSVSLYFNPTCWQTEDDGNPIIVKINGEEPSWFGPGYPFVVRDNTTVAVEQAVPVDMITVNVTVDNPANVVVYRGNQFYKDILTLTKGENTVSLPKESASLVITNVEKDGEESKITGVTLNGNPETVSYYSYFELNDLKAEDNVEIFTEEPMAELTFVVDDAERVVISISGEEISDLMTGSNTIDVMKWSNVTIAPKDGCILKSVVNSQDEEMTITNGEVTFQVYKAVPETYTITSEKAAEVNFTIEVDNPEKVKVTDKNYQVITLKAGENKLTMSELKFPLIIGAATYGQDLYKVTMNGVEVPNNYGYAVTPVENSEIVIVADFPDIDCDVTFTEVAGAESFFTAVMVNKEEVSDFSNGLKVKCGDSVSLYFNPTCWQTEDDGNPIIVKINGAEPSWFGPGYNFVVRDNTTVAVEQAVPAEMISVKVTVDNPANVVVYRGSEQYKDILTLTKGENSVSLPQEYASLVITNVEKDGEESKITGVTLNGSPETVSYYNYFELNDLDAEDNVKVFTEGNFGGTSSVNTINSVREIEGIYNLMGVKVAENAENLPAGIYVVNGKKIVVK